MPTFTVEQVRAARAFLGWTQVDLGQAANLSFETAAVRKAFKKAGVDFLKSGKRIGITIPVHQQKR